MAEKGAGRGTGAGHRPRRAHHEGRRAEKRPRRPPRRPPPRPAQAPRAPVAAQDAEREERVKMTRLRQTIAKRLKDAQNNAAMLTTYNEVDMTEVMALRNTYKDQFEKKHGVRLGFMSFFTKACVHALKEVPEGQCRDRRHGHRLQELRPHGHRRRNAAGPRGAGAARRRSEEFRGYRERDRRKGPPRARRQAFHGRDAGRDLHDLQWRGLRLSHVLADPEPTAIGHPRHAQDPGTSHGRGRRDQRSAR